MENDDDDDDGDEDGDDDDEDDDEDGGGKLPLRSSWSRVLAGVSISPSS